MRNARLEEALTTTRSLREVHCDSPRVQEEATKGMWSENICPNCQYTALDEEIMCLWEKQRYFVSYTNLSVACPRCGASSFPTLNLVELTALDAFGPLFNVFNAFGDRIEGGQHSTPSNRPPSEGRAKSNLSVIYLSPVALRVVLEDLLLAHGDDALNDRWLAEHRPYFRWNVIWFCARLRLPLPWVTPPGSEKPYVVIGRERSLVMNTASHAYTGVPSRKEPPSLSSLFPGATQSEERTLQFVLQI